jgi:MerR family mercuric resistance operon transcriptional regulator
MDNETTTEFTIGALAKAAEVGVETIRYYQRRGLLAEPRRRRGAYRVYGPAELARLRAIRRAQQLGFSLEEVDALLALNADTDRARARAAAQAKIALIDARIDQLRHMRDALSELVHCCHHTEAPAPCPILRALSADQAAATGLPAVTASGSIASGGAHHPAPQLPAEGGCME